MKQGRWVGLAVAILLVSLLTGCVESDTPPSSAEAPIGTVALSTTITAADSPSQTLTEYGLFYSTNRDDILAINGAGSLSRVTDFVLHSGVASVTVPANMPVTANQSETLGVSLSGLPPATT